MDDVITIGGSFAGLAAALQLVRARRKVTVIDTGLPRNRFARHSHGFLGHDHRAPADILADARRQLGRYPTLRLVTACATGIAGSPDDFTVTTETGEALRGRRVLLSYGMADQMPAIPGFAESWGKSIVPCPFCDGYEVAGRHWGLLWSGPHSHHAITLYRQWTDRITVFADGHAIEDAMRADMARTGTPLVEGRVTAIEHAGGQIAAVTLDDGRSLAVDVLFAHPRNAPSADLHVGLGLALAQHPLGHTITVDDANLTSHPGIYAAGDLVNPMASVTLATASGAMAGIHALRSMLV